ncbi:TPA: IS3 family transposase [Listeria innocua]|nr:IS3 family transposase [Listeria innocua]MBF2408578.1 IS3 family transposase [Listeria innocua]MDH4595727.1 IS3 family transposase [Listeria innocua]MDH4682530.1 IS3 family transposase [Listeria innocua]MDH4901012.1 IS3 family transposase [Listeria innocua]
MFCYNKAYKYAKSIVIQIVKDYIKYYNEKRIQQKLGYQSPINFRKQAAYFQGFLFNFYFSICISF